MSIVVRRSIAIASLLLSSGGWMRASAQAPKAVAGIPFQYWDVLEADGGARKVYFRNDSDVPITITEVVIQKCENTRQTCGTYPANAVVAPGKTVVAFRAERLDRLAGWSFAFSFHTDFKRIVTTSSGAPPSAMTGGRDGSPPVMVQSVAIDALVPEVAAFSDGGTCGKVTVLDLPPGHRALLMIFGTASQPVARRVMVRLDGNGSAYDFLDIRHNPDDSGPDPRQTQITLDLVRQTVTVRNSGGGAPGTLFRANGPTLLTAASLGKPGEVIARIVKECGAGH
jgi:hypothetical protein